MNRRPQLTLLGHTASPEEAAAVIAAVEQFMRDTAPPVADAVRTLDGVTRVNVGFDVLTDTEKGVLQRKLGRPGGLPEGALAQVSDVICIGSGKGGVGKSSLTVNLAVALAA